MDVELMVYEWYSELKNNGFDLQDVISVKTKNYSRKYGCCRLVKKYDFGESDFEITLANGILKENVSQSFIDGVIVHELIHTIPGCFNHSASWKKEIVRANELFGLSISINPYSKHRKIEDQAAHNNLNKLKKERKYVIECPCCNNKWRYKIMTKAVKHPEKYYCPDCKEKLIRIS